MKVEAINDDDESNASDGKGLFFYPLFRFFFLFLFSSFPIEENVQNVRVKRKRGEYLFSSFLVPFKVHGIEN